MVAAMGTRGAILVSGPLFYFLHLVIYQRPWFLFHYVLAGWILAWAFVRRGRLWLPMLLHSLGNLLAALDDILVLFTPRFVRWLLVGE
jgi:membrane protease YdiL (CAAX protease family)